MSTRASLCRSRIWRAWCPRSRTSRRPRTTSTACTTGCCPGRRRNLKTCGGWLFNCCVVHLSYPLLTDDLLVLIRPANRAKTVSGVSKYLSCEKLNKCNFENLSEVNINSCNQWVRNLINKACLPEGTTSWCLVRTKRNEKSPGLALVRHLRIAVLGSLKSARDRRRPGRRQRNR